MSSILNWVVSNLGWLFIISATGFVLFAFWLAFSRYGRIPLGADGEKPEFNTVSWIAMMFSAGMGIGLIFWGVTEPLTHFVNAPPGLADSKAGTALATALFHWGFHPWSMYAVVGLSIAYGSYRMGRRQLISSAFIPLLGRRAGRGPEPRWSVPRASTSGGEASRGEGRLRRKGARQGMAATRPGAGESGGCSVRNDVLVSPARTTGCDTSQRRNGRLVVTPTTSVSRSAAPKRAERLGARRPVGDQLRDHRVVCDPDLVAFLDACVHSDPFGKPQAFEAAGLGEESLRVLAYRRTSTAWPSRVGLDVELVTGGDAKLRLHEVHSGDQLGDRMLDLDAPVQLEEPEVASVDHELGGARAHIADRLRERDGGVSQCCAEPFVDDG